MTKNKLGAGGCVAVTNVVSHIWIENVTIERCRTQMDGGGLSIYGDLKERRLDARTYPSVRIRRLSIQHCSARTGGGCVTINDVHNETYVENVLMNNCSVKEYGGGLSVSRLSTTKQFAPVTVQNITCFECTADLGACVAISIDNRKDTSEIRVSDLVVTHSNSNQSLVDLISNTKGNMVAERIKCSDATGSCLVVLSDAPTFRVTDITSNNVRLSSFANCLSIQTNGTVKVSRVRTLFCEPKGQSELSALSVRAQTISAENVSIFTTRIMGVQLTASQMAYETIRVQTSKYKRRISTIFKLSSPDLRLFSDVNMTEVTATETVKSK
eukprot:PhF_6_TR27865/c0_g1_i4/m.40750